MDPRDRAPDVEVIRVIRATFVRGEGTKADPMRSVEALYSMDGELIIEVEPVGGVIEADEPPRSTHFGPVA